MNSSGSKLGMLALVVAASACGGGADAGDADTQLVDDAVAKLKECELYTPPSDPREQSIKDDYDRCAAKCVAEATCPDIKQLMCSDMPNESSTILKCLTACPLLPDDGFACSDASKIAHAALCDGADDCPEGEDETNCGTHKCADGEQLDSSDVKCDSFDDCGDGSDEAGCPNVCG